MKVIEELFVEYAIINISQKFFCKKRYKKNQALYALKIPAGVTRV